MPTLPVKRYTKDAPMPQADKDRFYWIHEDTVKIRDFFNLILCECPHCKHCFTCLPKEDA